METQTANETWEQRVQRERADERQRYHTLYTRIAELLPGWTVETRNDANYNSHFRLIDGQGHVISLNLPSGADRGKVHISGHWPQNGQYGPFCSPSEVREDSPSINCSLSRGYESIARDIQKRFLPEYLRIFVKCQERIAADNAYEARKAANWQKLVDTGLILGKLHCGEWRGGVAMNAGYGDVRMSSADSVQLDLRSLPIETAIRILRALKGVSDVSKAESPIGSVFNPHVVGEDYRVRFQYDEGSAFEVTLQKDGTLEILEFIERFSSLGPVADTAPNPGEAESRVPCRKTHAY
jgi:hypothetical protein